MKLLIATVLAASFLMVGAANPQPSSHYEHQRYYHNESRNHEQHSKYRDSDLIVGIGLGILLSKSLEDRQYRSYTETRGQRYGSSYDRCFMTPYYDYYGVKRWVRTCRGN